MQDRRRYGAIDADLRRRSSGYGRSPRPGKPRYGVRVDAGDVRAALGALIR